VEDAMAALADLKKRDPNLTALRTTVQLYRDPVATDHLLDGLRKTGFE
jgi:hypothetical protein